MYMRYSVVTAVVIDPVYVEKRNQNAIDISHRGSWRDMHMFAPRYWYRQRQDRCKSPSYLVSLST